MRITGGELGGRLLKVPRTDMRPTQDRVRGSLFSILGARVAGCRFLDLFAGTGAVGIEAWSRGATQIVWVESNPAILKCLEANVHTLCGAGSGRIVRGEVERVLRRGWMEAPFDLIFADPPYAKKSKGSGVGGRGTEEGRGTGDEPSSSRTRDYAGPRGRGTGGGADWEELLGMIEAGNWLAAEGWLVIEQGDDEPAVERAGWVMIRDRRYGGTRLRVLARAEETAIREA